MFRLQILIAFVFVLLHNLLWAAEVDDTLIIANQSPPEVLKEEIYLPNMCISADIANFFVSNGYVNVDLCLTRKIAASLVFSNKITGGINVFDRSEKSIALTDRERMYGLGIKYFHDFYKREDRSPYYLQVMLNMGDSRDKVKGKESYSFYGGSLGFGYCSISDSGIYTNTDIGIGYYTLGKNFYPKIGFEVGYSF